VRQGANVKRISVLKELNSSLNGFSQSVAQNIRSVQREINSTLDWIAERERHWQGVVRQRQAELAQAERALALCKARPPDKNGRKPNCSQEADAVKRAKRALDEAQKTLQEVLKWRRTLDNQISAYIGQATRLQRTTNTTLSQASTFLKTKANDLGDYQSIRPPGQIRVIGSRGAVYERAKQEMLRQALDNPLIGRDIKGWIRNELRRMRLGQADSIRMPGISGTEGRNSIVPSFDAGHRIHDVHHWSNLRFEDVWLNRSRYHRATRLGIQDRVR